jgi:hypothetical protein
MLMRPSTSLALQARCARQSSSWERRHPCLQESRNSFATGIDSGERSGRDACAPMEVIVANSGRQDACAPGLNPLEHALDQPQIMAAKFSANNERNQIGDCQTDEFGDYQQLRRRREEQ